MKSNDILNFAKELNFLKLVDIDLKT